MGRGSLFSLFMCRKKLIIQCYAMAGERNMERNIGYCKIVGVLVGERMADLGI